MAKTEIPVTTSRTTNPSKSIKHDGCFDDLVVLLKERPNLDINGIGKDGLSPLHVAVDKYWPDCAELLLSHGASPNTLSRTTDSATNGRTPFDYFIAIEGKYDRGIGTTTATMHAVFMLDRLAQGYSSKCVRQDHIMEEIMDHYPTNQEMFTLRELQRIPGVPPSWGYGTSDFVRMHVYDTNVSSIQVQIPFSLGLTQLIRVLFWR